MNRLVIIGGGPAGLSAAIYAARADLKPLVIAPSGGQLALSSEVGNYPGFPEELSGNELIDRMVKQAEKYGTEFVRKSVTKVDFSSKPFKIWVNGDEEPIESESVIIATGSSARWLGVPGEHQFRGKGVSACATCDGFFFRDKNVIVVGGGDTAVEEALFLTKFAKRVTIVHRRDELRASEFLQERASKNEKIDFLWNSEVKEFLGDQKVEKARVLNNQTNEESFVEIDGAFIAIGHQPNTKFLEGHLEMDEQGYIKVNDNTMTSVKGVFVAGDVADPKYQQAVVAAGTGVMAQIDAEKWLGEQIYC